MNCPRCGFVVSRVLDSRPSEDRHGEFYVWRRRECQGKDCRHRWSTHEREAVGKKPGTGR